MTYHGPMCGCGDCCMQRDYDRHIEEQEREHQAALEREHRRSECIAFIESVDLDELTYETLSKVATIINNDLAEQAEQQDEESDEDLSFDEDDIPF